MDRSRLTRGLQQSAVGLLLSLFSAAVSFAACVLWPPSDPHELFWALITLGTVLLVAAGVWQLWNTRRTEATTDAGTEYA